MIKKLIFILIITLLLVLPFYGTGKTAVIDNSLTITDVTPVQFCVVWGTTEPAYGTVNVFLDSGGTTPYAQAVVISESVKHPPAEDIGVIKIKVMGLNPDTEYFFQTETFLKRDNSQHVSPIQTVKTEKSSIIVRNDVLAFNVSTADNKSALGALVIAAVDGASYPVSAWVGEGVSEKWAAVDTNNFYHKDTHVNLELRGGETINLTLFGGSMGSVETQETVPLETGGVQSLKSSAILPASSAASSEGGGGGGGCFITTVSDSYLH